MTIQPPQLIIPDSDVPPFKLSPLNNSIGGAGWGGGVPSMIKYVIRNDDEHCGVESIYFYLLYVT